MNRQIYFYLDVFYEVSQRQRLLSTDRNIFVVQRRLHHKPKNLQTIKPILSVHCTFKIYIFSFHYYY